MKSADLYQLGFSEWKPFSLEKEKDVLQFLPKKIGVYILRSKNNFGRLVGVSDIIYVGSAINAKGIHHRVRFYFHPGPAQRTSKRINKRIQSFDCLEISYKVTKTKVEARNMEKDILINYENDHLELPPFNRQE